MAQNLAHESAFNCWVPHFLKKRDRIIALVKQRKARYLKKTHKFGAEVLTSVAHAFELDKSMEILSGLMESPMKRRTSRLHSIS